MKLIPLNTSLKRNNKQFGKYFAQVDDEDYDYLVKFKWHVLITKHTIYAVGNSKYIKGQKRTGLKMHRLIMNVTEPKKLVDHIDHNGLNCQKSNLRICTHAENSLNALPRINSTSKYKGVYKHKGTFKIVRWVAHIRFQGVQKILGYFLNEIEAAKAYDVKAIELFKEFAVLNFPKNIEPQP